MYSTRDEELEAFYDTPDKFQLLILEEPFDPVDERMERGIGQSNVLEALLSFLISP